MATLIPLDGLIQEEWYPGYAPEHGAHPWVTEEVRTFRREDEGRFWFLDFHWPRGLSPMGTLFLFDGYAWGTQFAAQCLPLPPGRGITQRLGGTHVYASEVPTASEWEIGFRAERIQRRLPRWLSRFPEIWQERVWELELGLAHFEKADLSRMGHEALGQFLKDARAFHRRAWEIHFEMMYPLLANYLGFYNLCQQLELDPGEISKFLQGYDTKILACDRGLWDLVDEARRQGLEGVFGEHAPDQLPNALRGAGSGGAAFMGRFEAFLGVHGWRTEGISDINLPSWIEDPTSPLGTIKTYLLKKERHDFEAARKAAVEERESAIDGARTRLSRAEQRSFDEALASCQHANFAWWNDEHNHYIDLRATLPLRRACLAIAAAAGCDREDDLLYLFWPEALELVSGLRPYAHWRPLVEARRQYYEHWREKRPRMPKMVGTIPEKVTDPILIEIFGMHHHFFKGVASDDSATSVSGMGVSGGVARGRARVLHSAQDLHQILPGEILICEATSPNWTPAFSKIAGCVCDGGGTLTHASIISREYRIPCVVGVGSATRVFKTGDLIEVNGTHGIASRI